MGGLIDADEFMRNLVGAKIDDELDEEWERADTSEYYSEWNPTKRDEENKYA